MNSRDQPQQNTLPLTEKEYYAIRELFGFMTAVAKHIGMLERRAKLKPGLWEELNEIEKKTQQAIQSMLVTIPIDKLRLIQKELPNIRVYAELETRKVYRKKGDEYSYVPFLALETILQDTIDWNCFACEKAGKELADCKIRKAVEATYPFELPGGSLNCCKFSGLHMEESSR